MVAYSTFSAIRGDYVRFLLISISALGLVIGWLVHRNLRSGLVVYRINSVLYGALILYMAVEGSADGSAILWMYTVPLIAFFLLGAKEGLYWTVGIAAVVLCVMIAKPELPFVHHYSGGFTVRFANSFVIVSVIAYWFERFRHRYRAGMEGEHDRLKGEIDQRKRAEVQREHLIDQLESALKDVRTLSGLIPICANCHRIRDDRGYWLRLEAYIQERSDATFSHSICPECSERLYPEHTTNNQN